MCNKLHIQDYVIVCGGARSSRLGRGNVMYVKADDKYCGLPQKIKQAFSTALQLFPNAAGFLKIDDDVLLESTMLWETLHVHDFSASIGNTTHSQDGTWHMGRCCGTKWNTTPFDIKQYNAKHLGIFKNVKVPSGGHCYYVSRLCAHIVASSKAPATTHVWEDMYVGCVLHASGIHLHIPRCIGVYEDNTIRIHNRVVALCEHNFEQT